MRLLLLAAAAGLFLFSCQQKEGDKSLPITYELSTFRVESAGGCRSDTLVCAFYEVSYPVFSGLDSAVARTLERKIEANVTMGNPEAQGESMKRIGEDFISDFEAFMKEIPDYGMGWHYEARVAVELLSDTLLTLSITEDYFTGGAHGGHGKYFININPKTGEDFTLDHYFKPGYSEQLRSIGDRSFRNLHELADTVSLQEHLFEFPNDRFELNKNYGFTKEGIVFYYNSYEIAAYASGPSEVLIPYDSLKILLR